MTHLELEPFIPIALWLPLAALTVGLLVWYAVASRHRVPRRRWWALMVLMTVAAVTPLAILLNPTWLQRIAPPGGKPLLTILVDRSISMGTPDGESGSTRLSEARVLAAEIAEQLADRYEVRLREFALTSSAISPEQLALLEADGQASDVAEVIRQALDEDRPQGQALLLLSDGIHNAGGGRRSLEQAVAKAKASAAPVYVKTLGKDIDLRDLDVRLQRSEELAFTGQEVSVVVTLDQKGPAAAKTHLVLKLDDKVLQERDVRLSPGSQTEEVFKVSQPANGVYRYTVEADALPDEIVDVNNSATMLLRVIDDPVGVLLLEGKPYWDTKFLIRTLAADPSINLKTVVRMAEGRLLQRTITSEPADSAEASATEASSGDDSEKEAPPVRRNEQWTVLADAGAILADPETLASSQIVILGRGAEVFLTDESVRQLDRWLREQDGALVCFRGQPQSQINERLGALMPVRWTAGRETRFRVKLSESGRDLRWIPTTAGRDDVLAGLPSLTTMTQTRRKPSAQMLAATTGSSAAEVPVIAHQQVGMGRVVVVEGAGMWRWDFLPPQYKEHDAIYGQLWQSLIHWLVAGVQLRPSQRLALSTDRVTFSTTEEASATLLLSQAQLAEEVPRIELTGGTLEEPRVCTAEPSGSSPSHFQVVFGTLPEGRYRARVVGAADDETSARTAFDVRDSLVERRDVRTRPNLMAHVATQSGGTVLEADAPAALAEQFEQHLAQTRPERIRRASAWDRWWILLAAMALWAASWSLRRRSGLV